VNEWWKTFFDQDHFRIWGQIFSEEANAKQAADFWSMLDLTRGSSILDAACGWGRLSRPLALLGATLLGVDQSETLLALATHDRADLPPERLRYLRNDLRTPLAETGFDVACNIFTSFGYGTEEEDVAMLRTLRGAVRPGGRVVLETNHRDLVCIFIAHGAKASRWLPDGTLFVDEPEFDAISGVVHLNWFGLAPRVRAKSTPSALLYTHTDCRLTEARRTAFHGGVQRAIKKSLQGAGAGGWWAAGCNCGAGRLAASNSQLAPNEIRGDRSRLVG
jgi:2-polyprenyl-3-methyl-5-hydroxy-6-metoxy-1,4-benzoquinol methylase